MMIQERKIFFENCSIVGDNCDNKIGKSFHILLLPYSLGTEKKYADLSVFRQTFQGIFFYFK